MVNQRPVSTGLIQQIQSVTSSSHLPDIPYSFVQFPVCQQENQLNCNQANQHSNVTRDISGDQQNSAYQNTQSEVEASCSLENRDLGNPLGLVSHVSVGHTEQNTSGGNQIMVNVGDDSFLPEQPGLILFIVLNFWIKKMVRFGLALRSIDHNKAKPIDYVC